MRFVQLRPTKYDKHRVFVAEEFLAELIAKIKGAARVNSDSGQHDLRQKTLIKTATRRQDIKVKAFRSCLPITFNLSLCEVNEGANEYFRQSKRNKSDLLIDPSTNQKHLRTEVQVKPKYTQTRFSL